MNFKTETTFEGQVLNGKIVDGKVVLDELFGVSLVDEVKLDRQQVKKLMYDLSTLHSEMKDSYIKDNGCHGNIKISNLSNAPYKVDDISFKWNEIIKAIDKRLKEFDKNNSKKLI